MTWRRAVLVLLALVVALDLIVAGVRVADVAADGAWSINVDGPMAYGMWKVRHGYPLYEWPTQKYFALTLYNFLFYWSYAAVFSALRVADESTIVAGRYLTAVYAVGGAAALYVAARQARPVPRSFRLPLLALVVCAWFGPVLPGWWTLAVRPDVAGVALAAAAVVLAQRGFATEHRRWLIAASLAFWLAWSFKQSHIALFAATCVYVVLWRRSIVEALALVVPFAVGVATALAIGGAVYRANILDAAPVNGFIPWLAVYWYRTVLFPNLLPWGVSLAALWAIVRARPRSLDAVPQISARLFGADLVYPLVCAIVAFPVGAMLLTTPGSAPNHVLEFNVAAWLVCASVGASLWPALSRRSAIAATLMQLPMAVFRVALLANDDGLTARVLQTTPRRVATLHLMTDDERLDRAYLAPIFESLPKPVYTDKQAFALPWRSTGNRYPAVIIDHVWYDTARAKGVVPRGVEGLFADQYFAAAVLADSSPLVADARRAGYRLTQTLPQSQGVVYVFVRD
jgi:hypothetical protein